jgi:hypothetical protein
MKQQLKAIIGEWKQELHNRQRYTCPNCESKSLLIRGPRGAGPLTREGVVNDLFKDLNTKEALRQIFGGAEPEYVNVRLQCESCAYDEEKSANDFEVDRIIEEKEGYPY